MIISSIYLQNFRKLLKCHLDFGKEKTLFVGANNSGKTSAMDALGKFLAGRNFSFNDFTLSNNAKINKIGEEFISNGDLKIYDDLTKWESALPIMDVWLEVEKNEIHYVVKIIPTLGWRGGKLGVRLIYQPKDISKLLQEYKEAYTTARSTETEVHKKDKSPLNLHPKDLCSFIEKGLSTYFSIKSYVLDPNRAKDDPPQPTSITAECSMDNPLKEIIKIDMIDAQRGFTDPDNPEGGEKSGKRLSVQMRNYYDKHLDPEKTPTPDDLTLLEATEKARSDFQKNLSLKFGPAIGELEGLGYPGVTDPKMKLTTKVGTSEILNHESAVQYSLNKNDETLMLPEKYNGLGYQNLISMVFDLMSFRDAWMRVGKAREGTGKSDAIEPLHLVLVEEPEAHLHMQVQQVFIRKAYDVLRNHTFLTKNSGFATQLVISTHSSHIARESNFADLRYFKRLPESDDCCIATAQVINLSDVFGKNDATDKFVTRYLQSTHCDLFFADAAILVEGAAESMLLPHFIRKDYQELYQSYLTILSINGRHSHRLGPLIKKLCLPILVITDLDSAENVGAHKSTLPKRNSNLISGNYSITKWLIQQDNIDILLDLPQDKKEFPAKTPYKYSIYIAYQTPVTITFDTTSQEALSSTFEDCMIYTNYELFKGKTDSEKGSLVEKVHQIVNAGGTFEKMHNDIYDLLRSGKTDQKAEFALDLIFNFDPKDILIPNYINEGLKWLQNILHP